MFYEMFVLLLYRVVADAQTCLDNCPPAQLSYQSHLTGVKEGYCSGGKFQQTPKQ